MSDWKEKAQELALSGMSWRKVAQELNIAKSTCSDYLRSIFKQPDPNAHKDGPRILVLDIETRYMLLEGWGLFNQNFSVDQIAEDWSLLSYSAKWYDSDEVIYSDVSEKTEDDVIAELHALLDEADFIIAHNGRRFDLKKIRARMVTRGFKPHSPVRVIDTLEICKKEFAFTSNKLLYLTKLLCKNNQKSDHGHFAGHKLWQAFLKGDPLAIQEMRHYNMMDVISLQELYDLIAPWSSTLPVFEMYQDQISLDDWELDGYHYSNLGKYQRYRNKKTGQYRRGKTNLLTKEQRAKLLSNII